MRTNALACFVALLFAVSAATAQPGQPDQARATALGHEALEAYGKNDWATAYDRFAAADAAAHSPVFVLYMARCKRSAGDLLAARDLLGRVAGESLPSGASELWKKARADAVSDLSALETRIPSIIVAPRGEASEPVVITVDDAPVSSDALRAPIRLNPGLHTVRAAIKGRSPITQSVRLVEGDAPLKVELTFAPEAPSSPSATSSSSPPLPSSTSVAPPPPPSAPQGKRGSLTPGLVVLGVGAAGIAAGGIMGGMALSTASDVKGRCAVAPSGGLSCARDEEANVDRARTLETAANVAFVVGGVAAGAGVALVLLRPGGGERGVTARLVPGFGALSVEGAF